MWLILEGRRYEDGSFRVDSAGFGYTSIEFFAPLANLDGIGVTIERRRRNDDSAGAWSRRGGPERRLVKARDKHPARLCG